MGVDFAAPAVDDADDVAVAVLVVVAIGYPDADRFVVVAGGWLVLGEVFWGRMHA